MSVELTVLVSLACALGGFCLSYTAMRRNAKKDAGDEGKTHGVVLTELGYIKSSLDDIKAEQKATGGKVADMAVKQAMMERDLKTAFARIDENKQEIRQYYKTGGRT